jgi:hypothetical protein
MLIVNMRLIVLNKGNQVSMKKEPEKVPFFILKKCSFKPGNSV